MPLLKPYLIFLLSFCLTKPTIGQDSIKEKANLAIQTQDWSTAIQLFSALIETDSTNANAWYQKGFSYVQLANFSAAIPDLLQAQKLQYTPAIAVDFNLAKAYAQTEKPEQALLILDRLSRQGFSAVARLKDSAFESIRKTTSFQQTQERVKNNAYPCQASEAHRRFDFWIGEWDVFVGERQVGNSSIRLAKGACAIHESYTTPNGYSGQSINFYDPLDKLWKQSWVGSSGDVSNYVENKEKYSGNIQFLAQQLTAQGTVIQQRMTFTYHKGTDTVVQLMESSSDEGKTWTISFNGLYKRKNNIQTNN